MSWDPVASKENLSALNDSKVPSDLTRTYLSSSKGKNVSFADATSVFDWLLEIVTANSFLIVRFESVRSTEAIKFLGSLVYNVLSVEVWKEDPRIARSLTEFAAEGGEPSQIPVTVVTPVTTMEFWDTETTEL